MTIFFPLAVINNSTMLNAPYADDLRLVFKFSLFDLIVGKPSNETLLKLDTHVDLV